MHSNLHDWLQWLENCKPLGDQNLDRAKQVAERLDIKKLSYPVITITGTNGKGSCATLLENILRTAGYKVGLYTSPHLLNFNERIRINDECITDDALCDLFAEINQTRQEIPLSYFEFVTLAALKAFQKIKLDAVILEVGIGGRLDATNIIDADIAVITTVALDHMQYLGDDREKIAYEKSGIMRAGKPVICGDFSVPETIHQRAEELNAPLFLQGVDFGYVETSTSWNWWSKTCHLDGLPLTKIILQNAATTLMVAELLKKSLPVSIDAIKQALKTFFIAGRFQILTNAKKITIVDVAHNPAAVEYLAKQLPKKPCEGKTFAVVAMLNDKDVKNCLQPLVSQIDKWFVAGLEGERGQSADALVANLQILHASHSESHRSVADAYQAACQTANANDRIIIFGSFRTVSEVLKNISRLS